MALPKAYRVQICFVLVFGIILYCGYIEHADSYTNYKRGLLAALFVLVAQGCLAPYTGPFFKGFESFWRGVARYTIIYLGILIFILFQKAEDARDLFKHLDPTLGKRVTREMHTYDDNCELTWDNFTDNLDHYYAMHWVGWFLSTLMIRDQYILHFWSILDEILELSWQHILPHFRECWWDHIVCDLMLSNTPAILLCSWMIKKLGLREFDWLGRKGKKSIKDWECFRDHRRFGGILSLVTVVIFNFLSGFFIINSLWIPPVNWINVYRLTVWFLLGSIAFGELHDDLESWGTPERRNTPISNEYRWIVVGICFTESVISFKFRFDTGNIRDVETPLYITIPWAITVLSCIGGYLYLRFKPTRTTKYGETPYEIEYRKKQGKLTGKPAAKTEKKPAEKTKVESVVENVSAKVENVVKKVENKVESKVRPVVQPDESDEEVKPQTKKAQKDQKAQKAQIPAQKPAETEGKKKKAKKEEPVVQAEEDDDESAWFADQPVVSQRVAAQQPKPENEWRDVTGGKTTGKRHRKRKD